jgi:hypothetical protein
LIRLNYRRRLALEEHDMLRMIRWFLAGEAALFAAASLMHAGVLVGGYEHAKAMIAESVIAAVLAAGLIGTAAAPGARRTIALAAQGFALLGTLVGLFTIAIGIGPRTAVDLTLHAVMVVLLVVGLLAVARGARMATGA